MLRWFKELRSPSLKCERTGHRPGIEYRRGFRKPSLEGREYRYYVCIGVTDERPACLRCRTPLGEWKETRHDGFTGFSWPRNQADEFNANGEIWDARGFRAA